MCFLKLIWIIYLRFFGLNITVATTAKTKEEALYLLKKLNFPIKNNMARKSLTRRNEKTKLSFYIRKRQDLLAISNNEESSFEDRLNAQVKLSNAKRWLSSRYRNRCQLTGRPKGKFKKVWNV